MSLTERFNKIFANGAVEIIIARPPGQDIVVVQVKQQVKTGPEGNATNCMHQRVNRELITALEEITADVEYAAEKKTSILQVHQPDGNSQ